MLVVQCTMLVVLLETCMKKKTTNFQEPVGPEQWQGDTNTHWKHKKSRKSNLFQIIMTKYASIQNRPI